MSAKSIPFPHKKYGMYYVEESLRDAAYRGDINQVKELFSKYPRLNANAVNEYNETALYIACKRNQSEIAEFLLQLPKVDVNVSTILGNSALLISAWNDNTDLAKILVAHNADIHARTNSERQYHGGVSALDIAKERENTQLYDFLLPLISCNSKIDRPNYKI